jgi:hypothetical protein
MRINLKYLFIALLVFTATNTFAQVGIGTNTPAASAALEVTSDTNNKGILIPRMTSTQKDAISNPAEGLMIFQTSAPVGFYFYTGASWRLMVTQTDLDLKVAKVSGKDLSSNDYTIAEKTKVSNQSGTNTGDQDLSALASNAALSLKANAADVTTEFATKVDKLSGKELSSNDYTTAEKTKVFNQSGINTGDQDLSSLASIASVALKAPIENPVFTGTPSLPSGTIAITQAPADNSTKLATTAYANAAAAAAVASSGVADNSVTSAKIADGTIATADIANAAITNEKISAVAGSKITGVIPVSSGGTGETTVSGILSTLGFASNNIAIGRDSGTPDQDVNMNTVSIGGGAGDTNQGQSAIAIGYVSGNANQGANALAIGGNTAQSNQGTQAVALGFAAGQNNQGAYSVALGSFAGNSQVANSIAINASGTTLNPANAGFYVNPIRSASAKSSILYYDTSTKEVTSGTSGLSLANFTESNYLFNNKTGVKLLATNVATNVDLVFSAKGTGALLAQQADGTTLGGNNRGTKAVDLQRVRAVNTQVASGPNAVIVGGENNTASGMFTFIGGGGTNSATGSVSFIGGGSDNIAGGEYSFVGGGFSNTASGLYSTIGGGISNTAQSFGETVFGLNATVGAGTIDNFVATDRLFIIGNGTETSSRSNALTVLKNANTTIGGSLTVNGNGSDNSFALPSVRGTNGQVLTTNGSGLTSWTSASGGINSGVPYTGATQAVNLGVYDLTVNGLTIGRGKENGFANTAIGNAALKSNTEYGFANTAIGFFALSANTSGSSNTANGYEALKANDEGRNNSANGYHALKNNINGSNNSANGYQALFNNTTGSNNSANGYQALSTNTTGSFNTAIGYQANVASNNLTNATAIGNGANVANSSTIQLGNTSVTNVNTSGTYTGSGFKTPTGTSSQYLMANGSVSKTVNVDISALNNYDVSQVGILIVTGTNSSTFGFYGLAGGVSGQIIYFINNCVSDNNYLQSIDVMPNNNLATQKFKSSDPYNNSSRISKRTAMLIFDGTNWHVLAGGGY